MARFTVYCYGFDGDVAQRNFNDYGKAKHYAQAKAKELQNDVVCIDDNLYHECEGITTASYIQANY